MKKKTLTDKTIIFLTFVLLIFHTFTYLQLSYSFYVTCIVFCIIVLLAIVKNGGKVYLNESGSLFALIVAVLLVAFLGVYAKEQTLIRMVGAYAPLFIWPVLYRIINPILSGKEKRKFLIFFLIFYTISILATLTVVLTDHEAARLLAGSATFREREHYYRLGVGGYGFVYGSVFLIYGFILWLRREQNRFLQFLLITLIALIFVMILFASYTTALLLAIACVVLSLYSSSQSRVGMLIFLLVVICLLAFISPLLVFIREVAGDLELYWVEDRVGKILNAIGDRSFSELRRFELYSLSLNSFFDNPLIGGKTVGGHSMLFDSLGEYGLFGGFLFFAFSSCLFAFRKQSKKRVGVVYYCIIMLLAINTMDTIVMLPMIAFVLPLILSLDSEIGKQDEEHFDH